MTRKLWSLTPAPTIYSHGLRFESQQKVLPDYFWSFTFQGLKELKRANNANANDDSDDDSDNDGDGEGDGGVVT